MKYTPTLAEDNSHSHVRTDRSNKRETSYLVVTVFDHFNKKIMVVHGHPRPHSSAGGDSVAEELFPATPQAAQHRATDERTISAAFKDIFTYRYHCELRGQFCSVVPDPFEVVDVFRPTKNTFGSCRREHH